MYYYIDPGTGSMLFTILIGLLSAAFFALRGIWIKIRFSLSGGRAAKAQEQALPLVIFTDSGRYWNMFGPICDVLEKRGQETLYLTADASDPALNCHYEHVRTEFAGDGNKAFVRMNLIRAKVVLSSTPGLEVYQWKRSKDAGIYVHIPHMASDMTMYRMFGIDYYDVILLSAQFQGEQVRKLEALRNLPQKELYLVGLPYLDTLAAQLDAAPPLASHERTVLLAPSWGPTAILTRYGDRILSALLATGYRIIVRPHPQSFISEKEQMERLQAQFPESEQLHWDRERDNFESLHQADILISDFSGVIFDFTIIFDKPILYADVSFDPSVYDAWWLKEELWTFAVIDKLGLPLREEDFPQIGQVIEQCISSKTLSEGREQVRETAWTCKGQSAENVADVLQNLIRRQEETPAKTGEKKEGQSAA